MILRDTTHSIKVTLKKNFILQLLTIGFQIALKWMDNDYDPTYITLDFFRYATTNKGVNTTWIGVKFKND